VRNPDGTETLVYRSATALGDFPRQFLRMMVTFRP
jgi:hypothetical protein